MKTKHNLIEDEVFKEIISHIRTNSKKETIVNKISFKYRQYKDILKESEKGLSLLNHLENHYEIILKDVSKLKIESIYNINENQI